MENDNSFAVYMYANEYKYLEWLVLQKQDIETGGDLFGAWQNEHCAVVQFVLGPGKDCRRTATSFFQDVSYLQNVGNHLTSNEGICNVGEWHSHHRLGLARPSDGDQNTVWGNLGTVSGGRFLLFIANIQYANRVNVGCFMFNSATRKMTQGKITLLENCSPIRHSFTQRALFKLQAETYQDWEAFNTSKSTDYNRRTPSWRRSRVDDLESCERLCVCDIPVLDDSCKSCWDSFKEIIFWVARCLLGLFSACGRCCCDCILRPCFCCMYRLYRRHCSYSRRPADD